MIKALVLLSGGLDSMLAARILKEQGIKVTPICFLSYFFGCSKAEMVTKQLGLKLRVVDFSKEHLKIVKSPEYGYGKAINPCIDCHLLMIRKAKAIMKKEKYDFIATGEVLGERPLSQNPRALAEIERAAGLKGFLLRPLSAKLLPETIPEKKGQVKRDKLFAISGRSRTVQLSLVKKFKFSEFSTPAGGCILTDQEYGRKLKELLKKIPEFDGNDCQILRKGRVFWQSKFLTIVGRNEKENQEIGKLRKKTDLVLEPENFPGPTVLVREFGKKMKKEVKEKGKELLLKYSKKISKTPKINEV